MLNLREMFRGMKFRLAAVVIVLTFCTRGLLPAHADTLQISLKDAGSGDITLQGMFGTGNVWVPFQSNWAIKQDIQVTVIYRASPLLNTSRSTLTVFANDLQVTSIRLSSEAGDQTFSFTVPASRLAGAGLAL